MNSGRSARALHHLTLALAGVALTLAELPYLPWLPFGLIAYLVLILIAHTLRGGTVLPVWLANSIALLMAGGTWFFVMFRGNSDGWSAELPLSAALVPYLGPVLMVLLCLRLYRPRSQDDFWLLQGLGLLQIKLGCVLASGTLFALALLAYVVTAAATLAAGERERRGRSSAWVTGPLSQQPDWMPLGLRWGAAVASLTILLFLLTPRSDQPEWDPLSWFGMRQQRFGMSRIGFSEEIDLSRSGRLIPDESIAFWVESRDKLGQLTDQLTSDSRFRGVTLDRYEQGVWRSESAWMGGLFPARVRPTFRDLGPEAVQYRFCVPRRTGGLFLLDPLPYSEVPNQLPIRVVGGTRETGPYFFENGGTAIPIAFMGMMEYRYDQFTLPDQRRDRVQAPSFRESYVQRLLRGVPGLESWTRDLLLRSSLTSETLRRELTAYRGELAPIWWETMARTLCDHLAKSGEYGYSLQKTRSDPNLDPTIDFLWHVKNGPCERYASALALMLRSLGVPTRLIKGYVGAERQSTGLYLVRQSQAHAWVEALVPSATDPDGYDWLVLDPTPSSETPVSTLAKWWERQQRSGQEFWRELVVNYNHDQRARMLDRLASPEMLLSLVHFLLLLAVGAVAFWVVGIVLPRRRKSPALDGLTDLITRLRRCLTAPGRMVAVANTTPGEWAEQARNWLNEHGYASCAIIPMEIVRLYYRVRFGEQPADAAELREAVGRVATLEVALRRRLPTPVGKVQQA